MARHAPVRRQLDPAGSTSSTLRSAPLSTPARPALALADRLQPDILQPTGFSGIASLPQPEPAMAEAPGPCLRNRALSPALPATEDGMRRLPSSVRQLDRLAGKGNRQARPALPRHDAGTGWAPCAEASFPPAVPADAGQACLRPARCRRAQVKGPSCGPRSGRQAEGSAQAFPNSRQRRTLRQRRHHHPPVPPQPRTAPCRSQPWHAPYARSPLPRKPPGQWGDGAIRGGRKCRPKLGHGRCLPS